jgi:hypothetical protein
MRKKETYHIEDLKETFANLMKVVLKLNPKKCVFEVSKGKMLGYIISSKGIRASPDKTKAIRLMVDHRQERRSRNSQAE